MLTSTLALSLAAGLMMGIFCYITIKESFTGKFGLDDAVDFIFMTLAVALVTGPVPWSNVANGLATTFFLTVIFYILTKWPAMLVGDLIDKKLIMWISITTGVLTGIMAFYTRYFFDSIFWGLY